MIAAVTILYALSGAQQVMQGQYGLAIFLGGCSIANVGVMMMARG
jgi:hypothetical protein